MVAYSFKKRFVDPIRVGLSSVSLSFDCLPKRQTIRAIGKRRHARPGDLLQLYTGMRTRQCELIGRARCTSVDEIVMFPNAARFKIVLAGVELNPRQTQIFARADGFFDEDDMRAFWLQEHKSNVFEGVRIKWEAL